MTEDFLETTFKSQPFIRLLDNELWDQVSGIRVVNFGQNLFGEPFLHILNYFFVGAWISKWWCSHQEFIDQNSETIVIEFVCITLFSVDIRRHRVGGSTDSEGSSFFYQFCFAQVDHLYLPLFIDHKVRRFYVPVNVTFLVESAHNLPNLGRNYFDDPFVQRTHHLQYLMERETFHHFHEYVQIVLILESAQERAYPLVV